MGNAQETPLIGWNRFSCLAKLRRITAYVLRFVVNVKKKRSERVVGYLSVSELKAAQVCILKRAQSESFEEELKMLQKGKVIPKQSRLMALDPKLEK